MCRCRVYIVDLSFPLHQGGPQIEFVSFLPISYPWCLVSCWQSPALQRLLKPGGWDCCLFMLYQPALEHERKCIGVQLWIIIIIVPVLDTGHSGAVDSGHRDTELWPPETSGHWHRGTPALRTLTGYWDGALIHDWLPMCWTSFLSVFSAFLNNKPAQMLVNSI